MSYKLKYSFSFDLHKLKLPEPPKFYFKYVFELPDFPKFPKFPDFPKFDFHKPEKKKTIADIAIADPDNFTILVKALQATSLVSAVADKSADLTVFAPTDAAFTQLAVDLGYRGDTADKDAVFDALVELLGGGQTAIDTLTNVLLYHVAPGSQSAQEIADAGTVETLFQSAPDADPETIGANGATLEDKDPDLQDPTIVIPDVEAKNGVIQVIDRVLLPIDVAENPVGSIDQVAEEAGEFSILLAALSLAGLADDVATTDDITVFAPTDAAFAATAGDLGLNVEGLTADEIAQALVDALGAPAVTDILLYHVSPGAKTRAELEEGAPVTTLLSDVTFAEKDGGLVDVEGDIENPSFIDGLTDLPASNGTIHSIDRVLLPIDVFDPQDPVDGEHIRGTRKDDEILGTIGGDEIVGRRGDDHIAGDGGDDKINAGRGHDSVDGGEGEDHINGGKGDDSLTGGADADVFKFVGRRFGEDEITDFDIHEDTLLFTAAHDLHDIHFGETADGDAILTVGHGSATLIGVTKADAMTSDAFLFS